MTASGPGVPGRGSSTDDTPRRGIGREIVLILGIGLIARLILAYGLPPFFGSPIPGSGFKTDLDLFRYWADSLAQHGPFGFYDRGFFADYTPGYLYALWLVGVVGSFIGGVGDLIKLPAIITDVALAYVVYTMVLELDVTERRARLAALVVILNPITWFDSVVWGQVDSFGTVFLLLAVRELWRGRTERSAILAVVAALIKPQLAILVPIVGLVTIRRALWPAGAWGDEEPPAATGIGWERRTTGWIRIATTAVSGLVTTLAMCIPFGLWPIQLSGDATSLIKLMLSTASTYPYISVNAYNAWAVFPVADASGVVNSMASNSSWIYDSPAKDATFWAQIGPFPAGLVGAVALLTLAAVVTVIVARRPDRLTILVGTAVLALAFFAVPTRVHERYLFPLFGLGAILVAFSWRWRIAYLLASIATFLNMYVVLTSIYPDNPSVADWLGIGDPIRSYWGVAVIATINTLVFLWGIAQLRGRASRALVAELESGRVPDEDWPDDEDGHELRAGDERHAGWVAAATGEAPAEGPGSLVPAWFDRPSLADTAPIAWLRARINETPFRPDRSASLKREKGGRLDRLDLWMVIVMVIAAMFLRTYRLAEPARMHFDEVYHARTATEFLQDWRYGLSHNIYEWTHPHLAKYMMAAGIVVFAGHDVAASSSLGVNVDDAVIEPRFDDPTQPDARLGDRVFVVTGSELIAYDLQTRREEASWGIRRATTVTYDATTHIVTVGTNTGALETVDATSLDQVRAGVAGAAPAAPSDLVTLDAAPVQLLAWKRIAPRRAHGRRLGRGGRRGRGGGAGQRGVERHGRHGGDGQRRCRPGHTRGRQGPRNDGGHPRGPRGRRGPDVPDGSRADRRRLRGPANHPGQLRRHNPRGSGPPEAPDGHRRRGRARHHDRQDAAGGGGGRQRRGHARRRRGGGGPCRPRRRRLRLGLRDGPRLGRPAVRVHSSRRRQHAAARLDHHVRRLDEERPAVRPDQRRPADAGPDHEGAVRRVGADGGGAGQDRRHGRGHGLRRRAARQRRVRGPGCAFSPRLG